MKGTRKIDSVVKSEPAWFLKPKVLFNIWLQGQKSPSYSLRN